MVVIKVTYSNEIRRFQLPEESNALFALLTTAVSDSFGLSAQDIRITYVDDEGDKCVVGGNDELREALRFFKSSPVKLTIERFIRTLPAEAASIPVEAPASSDPVAQPEPEVEASASPVEEVAAAPVEVAPIDEILASAPAPAPAHPSVEFVRDVTLPDGSVQVCSTQVLKTWEIRNNGSFAWPAGSKLVLVRKVKSDIGASGDRAGVPIPSLLPGESTEVTVPLRLPGKRKEGSHKIFFKVVTAKNIKFDGDFSLFADLKVEAPLPALTKQQFLRTVPVFLSPAELNGEVDGDMHASLSTLLEQHQPTAVHTNIRCDGCNVFPIKGARFQCTVCPDFDLCEACEATGTHPLTHPLLKLQRPRQQPQTHGHGRGHGRRGFGCFLKSLLRPDLLFGPPQPSASCAAAAATPAQPDEVAEAEVQVEAPACDEAKECPSDEPAAEPAAAAPAAAPAVAVRADQRRVRADFVADTNLPDGSQVLPGASLTKKWSLKNTGNVAWPEDTVLMDVSKKPHVVAAGSVVPLAQPGETVEVSVELPVVSSGRNQRVYRLEAENTRFGPRVWLDINGVDGVSAHVATPFALPVFPSASSSAPAAPAAASVPVQLAQQPAQFALPLLNAISSLFSPVASIPVASAPVASPVASAPTSSASPIPAVPTAVSASPSSTPLVLPAGEEYPDQLQLLHAIGFDDITNLRTLLVAANGDVQRVINWLLTPGQGVSRRQF